MLREWWFAEGEVVVRRCNSEGQREERWEYRGAERVWRLDFCVVKEESGGCGVKKC